MDSSIHRLCVQQVLDHPAVPEKQKLALHCFLKSWYGKDGQGAWMRSQHGWKEAAALLASARFELGAYAPGYGKGGFASNSGVNPYRILMCAFGNKLCERGDQCRRCALDRIDFAWSEFLPAWDRAQHWYALVLATDRRAKHAGIHQGDGTVNPMTAALPVYQPFTGKPDGCPTLHTGSELE